MPLINIPNLRRNSVKVVAGGCVADLNEQRDRNSEHAGRYGCGLSKIWARFLGV